MNIEHSHQTYCNLCENRSFFMTFFSDSELGLVHVINRPVLPFLQIVPYMRAQCGCANIEATKNSTTCYVN